MKKTILITALILLSFSGLSFGRTAISPEESATVDVLMQTGVVDKERTEAELNEPLTAIDSMSMTLKGLEYTKAGMIARDKEIIDKLNAKIVDLEDDVTGQSKLLNKYKKDLKDIQDAEVEKNKILTVVGMLLFLIGIAN